MLFLDLDATLKKVEGGRKENQDAVKKFETEKKVFECPSIFISRYDEYLWEEVLDVIIFNFLLYQNLKGELVIVV